MKSKQIDIIKHFFILGFSSSFSILIAILSLTSVLFMCGLSLNINTHDLIGLNILNLMISKESFKLSIKTLGMLFIFIISGAIGALQKIKNYS